MPGSLLGRQRHLAVNETCAHVFSCVTLVACKLFVPTLLLGQIDCSASDLVSRHFATFQQ